MNVKIDRDGCISCGLCVSICPNVFRIADDGFSEVYGEPTSKDEHEVKEAAENCPVQVIHVEEE